jgi:TorA maturation chaperone TorD
MELIRALGALAELPGREQTRLAELLGLAGAPSRADYTALFVLEMPPYASLYLGDSGMMGGAVRERVAGFWGALGQAPPGEPDHLAALLGFYAAIEAREETQDEGGASLLRHARKALYWEHLACWLAPYLVRAAELSAPAYRAWAVLLLDTLAAEAEALGAPNVAPLHFREAVERLEPGADSAQDLAAALLTPARSGLILGRSDLARMSHVLGVGARVGGRRFVLAGLLEQMGEEAPRWLVGEAERQARLYGALPSPLEPVRDFWRGRAERSADVLARLGGGGGRP